MATPKGILLFVALGLLLSMTPRASASSAKQAKESGTHVVGKVLIATKTKELKVSLRYSLVAQDSARKQVRFFLVPEMTVAAVEGTNIKSYDFDRQAKPFACVQIRFKQPLAVGEQTSFSVVYAGKPSQGFWVEDQHWVDIDPDFMLLPLFTTLEDFTYRLEAATDDKAYAFYDLNRGQSATNLHIVSATPTYYFQSIIASDNAANGMALHRINRHGYRLAIFTAKPDSADYVADAADRMLNQFNTTFGRKEPINGFTVLYRPLPPGLHRVTRSFQRSVVFATSHGHVATLAHEVSHFWWSRGNALTTEKWLNESFAQYSQFLFIRQEQGEEKFESLMAALASRLASLPPLLGSNRFSDQGFSLIYEKGPYLLYGLEKRIGRPTFMELLVELNHRKVSTTQDLLLLLEQLTSAPIRKEFEAQLNS
jgi:hypothetical protein